MAHLNPEDHNAVTWYRVLWAETNEPAPGPDDPAARDTRLAFEAVHCCANWITNSPLKNKQDHSCP